MISRWKLKAAAQGTLSMLPQPWRWNRLLQQLNGSLDPRTRVVGVAERLAGHLERYATYGGRPLPESTVVELGTGTFPLFAVLLALSGAREVVTFDIVPLATNRDIGKTLAAVAEKRGGIERHLSLARPDRLERIPELAQKVSGGKLSGREALAELGVRYRVQDATDTGLEAESVDLITSNDVLEHIPERTLAFLYREFVRITRPDGVMSHFINMGDHYAAADPSIGSFNFYRYSEGYWRVFNNSLQYQNRLRASDHAGLLNDAGWKIVDSEATDASLNDLPALNRIDPEFRRRSTGDLIALHVWFVCRLDGAKSANFSAALKGGVKDARREIGTK